MGADLPHITRLADGERMPEGLAFSIIPQKI